MTIEEYFEKIESFDTVLPFGYTDAAVELIRRVRSRFPDKRIVPVDNSRLKWKQNGGACISAEEAVREYPEGIFTVVPDSCRSSIENQLKNAGVLVEHIVPSIPDEICETVEGIRVQRNRVKRDPTEFTFEINIVRHCNLNCKCCNHFSPLAKERYEDPKEYDGHLERLAELFDGKIKQILLIGGEPLLHPNITEFFRIVRKHFQETRLCVMTNGLLLKKMEDAFWDACRKYRVAVQITRYPIDLSYDELETLVTSNGLSFEMVGGTEISARTLWYEPKDLSGTKDPEWEFTHCAQANRCYTLEGSRLYGCVVIPGIPTFNEYFGVDLAVSDKDGIDIYEAESADQIMNFFAKPYPFCRYCDWERKTWDNAWGLSERKITEWT